MRVRRLVKSSNSEYPIKDIVWFGSYGKNEDGTAKFVNVNDKHDNFVSDQAYVADMLTQKLSIIQNELWWNISYGLPLTEKLNSKTAIDASVMSVIMNEDSVKNILTFESELVKHKYTLHCEIESIYGIMNINI